MYPILIGAGGVALAIVGFLSITTPVDFSQVWTIVSARAEIAGVQMTYGWVLAASGGLILIAAYLKSAND
jgi:hypothetical protein